jgi:hypothetical protein
MFEWPPLKTFFEKLIKIDILLSHVNVNKMSMVTSPSEQHKTSFFRKNQKNGEKTENFFQSRNRSRPKTDICAKKRTRSRPKSKSQDRRALLATVQNLAACSAGVNHQDNTDAGIGKWKRQKNATS